MVNIAQNEAIVNITFAGSNGDLKDPVLFDATDEEIKTWATEAVRNGGVSNVPANPNANFEGYVIEKYSATEEVDYNRIFLRPKTTFG